MIYQESLICILIYVYLCITLIVAIKCEPLKQVTNGQILPENCSGPEKVAFSTNCTITCKKGFVLEGPHSRYCGGRSGVWTQRRTVNRCVGNMKYVHPLS